MLTSSSQDNYDQIEHVKEDIRSAFLLTYFLVYEYDAIVRLKIEKLKIIRQNFKIPNHLNTETSPELWKVLKIFDDYIEIREHKKDEKKICQKATDILRGICRKIITFFSSCFSCIPVGTFSTNEVVALHGQSNKNSESSHRFFSFSTPDKSYLKSEAGKTERHLM